MYPPHCLLLSLNVFYCVCFFCFFFAWFFLFFLGGGGDYSLDQSSDYNKACFPQVSFDHWSAQTYNNKIAVFCFSSKHSALRSKTKDWWHQGPSWAACLLLFQRASTTKIQTIYCNEMFSNYLALVQR